jgi:hypothetical protein
MTDQSQFPHQVTKVDKRSWFKRLGSSLRGVLTGLLLFVIAFPILIWNEGRSIQIDRSLQEGASVVESTEVDSINPEQDEKLIHFIGEARTPSTLTDNNFAISESALKLRRIVELYQWSEEQNTERVEKIGGGTESTTTYSYKQVWSDRLINTQDFQEQTNYSNPQSKPLENEEQIASPVSVGAYTLPDRLIGSLSEYERLTLANDLLADLPNTQQEQWQVFNNYIYQSEDPSNPKVGDVRVWYQILRPGIVSVMARQQGETLQAYKTKNDRSIEMIRLGEVSAEEMFEGAVETNRLMAWAIRLLGFLFMFIGLNTLLAPLTVLVSIIPMFARILRFGTKLLTGTIALVLSLITIGVAWLLYRPLIGLAVLLVAVVIIVIFSKLKPKAKVDNKN